MLLIHMAAILTIDEWNGSTPLAASALPGIRFRADDTPLLDTMAPVLLPAPTSPLNLTVAVTAQNTAQTVTVNSSAALSVNQTILISPGQPAQEAVTITAIPNATSLTAIFGRSHVFGAPFQQVTASYPKNLQARLIRRPATAVSKLRFFRRRPMPVGVYDQYRLLTAYAQATSAAPWVSDGALLYPMVPSGAEEVFAPGPFQAVGSILPLVSIQWLYTAAASGPLDSTLYRFVFDES